MIPVPASHTDSEDGRLMEQFEIEEADEVEGMCLCMQAWLGRVLGIIVCLILGVFAFMVVFTLEHDLWVPYKHYWEGVLSIVASMLISTVGFKVVKMNKRKSKWRTRFLNIINQQQEIDNKQGMMKLAAKLALFILPFLFTLREGLEMILFLVGIGISINISKLSILYWLSIFVIVGGGSGFVIYKFRKSLTIESYLIILSSVLHLIGSGLFSKGVGNIELQTFIDKCNGVDGTETGYSPVTYDVVSSVWHINCCRGDLDSKMWLIFRSILGWNNSATYQTIGSYVLYWGNVITTIQILKFEELNGYYPIIPSKYQLTRIRNRLKDL